MSLKPVCDDDCASPRCPAKRQPAPLLRAWSRATDYAAVVARIRVMTRNARARLKTHPLAGDVGAFLVARGR